MSQDLILFVLPNGAELIGRISSTDVSANETRIWIEHPLVIRPVKQSNEQYALDFFPHSLADPEGIHEFFRSQFISISVNIPAPLSKAYMERTSRLILATHLDNLENASR